MGLGSDSTFAKGDRVDRFEIDELIAEGGMGAIYRAIDTRLRRTVALKVVRADRLDSTSGDVARQRFLREALAISRSTIATSCAFWTSGSRATRRISRWSSCAAAISAR